MKFRMGDLVQRNMDPELDLWVHPATGVVVDIRHRKFYEGGYTGPGRLRLYIVRHAASDTTGYFIGATPEHYELVKLPGDDR